MDVANIMDQSYSFSNQTIEGSAPQLYDSATADSPELMAHQNRVYKCSDHPQVEQPICSRASDPCFCAEHESYTYSFCRKSCGFCNDEELVPREYWRVRAYSQMKEPLHMESILFYHSALDRDIVTTEHSLGPYLSHKSQFPIENIKFFPNGWFESKMNRFNVRNDSYIGYKFGYPIIINAIKTKFGKKNKHKLFVVEASSSPKGPFLKRWLIRTEDTPSDDVYYKHNCPVLWRSYEARNEIYCLKLMANYSTWRDAEKECQNYDAELVSVRNWSENDFIKDVIRPCGKVWIGYNDIAKEGNFVWSDGYKNKKKYENWEKSTRRSEAQNNAEDCVTISSVGKWETDVCSNLHYYICKKLINNIPKVEYDKKNVNLDAPMLFFADDLSNPVLNTSETNQRKLKEDAFFDIRLSNYLPHDAPQ